DLYNGSNNGQVIISARAAARRLGISSKDTASVYLCELEAKGFVKPRQCDAFTAKDRHATEWVLTEFPFAGAPPTKDFMRWRPGDVLTERAPPARATQPGTKSRSRSRNCGQAVPDIGT